MLDSIENLELAKCFIKLAGLFQTGHPLTDSLRLVQKETSSKWFSEFANVLYKREEENVFEIKAATDSKTSSKKLRVLLEYAEKRSKGIAVEVPSEFKTTRPFPDFAFFSPVINSILKNGYAGGLFPSSCMKVADIFLFETITELPSIINKLSEPK